MFVFGQNSDSEYYSYSYSVQKTVFAHLCGQYMYNKTNKKKCSSYYFELYSTRKGGTLEGVSGDASDGT